MVKKYPYPHYKNPIRLSPQTHQAREQLKELAIRIMANDKLFQRKNDKIPALPIYFPNFKNVSYFSWCFECFELISEALRKRVIKNRNDARFWGLGEKKTLCGSCLGKRLTEMTPQNHYRWAKYQKRGYWELN